MNLSGCVKELLRSCRLERLDTDSLYCRRIRSDLIMRYNIRYFMAWLISIVMPCFNARKYHILHVDEANLSIMLLLEEMVTYLLIGSLTFGTHFLIILFYPLLLPVCFKHKLSNFHFNQ